MLFRRANLPQRGVRRIEALGIDPDGLLTSTWQRTIVTPSGLPFEGLLTLMSLCGLMRCLTISQTMRRVGRSCHAGRVFCQGVIYLAADAAGV
jgi:hypothetical protein